MESELKVSELKVSDLIPLSEDTYRNTAKSLNKLKNLSEQYHKMSDMYDPYELERVKREFDSEMQNLSSYYAAVKKFKGAQHVYLDEVRKRVKAEALQIILDEGVKVTAAGDLVYKSKYYIDRISLMEDIKEFMIKVELLYERYDTTFQSIIQSLSTAKREYENSQK